MVLSTTASLCFRSNCRFYLCKYRCSQYGSTGYSGGIDTSTVAARRGFSLRFVTNFSFYGVCIGSQIQEYGGATETSMVVARSGVQDCISLFLFKFYFDFSLEYSGGTGMSTDAIRIEVPACFSFVLVQVFVSVW